MEYSTYDNFNDLPEYPPGAPTDWQEELWYEPDSVTRYQGIHILDERWEKWGLASGEIRDAEDNLKGVLERGKRANYFSIIPNALIVDAEYERNKEGNPKILKWMDIVTEIDWRNAGGYAVLVNHMGEVKVTDKEGNQQSGITKGDLVILEEPEEEIYTNDFLLIFPPGKFRSQEIMFWGDIGYYLGVRRGKHPGPNRVEFEIPPAKARLDIELPATARYADDLEEEEEVLVQHPFQSYDVAEPSKLTFGD